MTQILLLAQDAGRDEVQDVFLLADEDRVAGVVAALRADDDVRLLGQHVNDLAFAFVAPLGADQNCIRHSYPWKTISNPPRQRLSTAPIAATKIPEFTFGAKRTCLCEQKLETRPDGVNGGFCPEDSTECATELDVTQTFTSVRGRPVPDFLLIIVMGTSRPHSELHSAARGSMRVDELPGVRRFQFCDTAECNSALRAEQFCRADFHVAVEKHCPESRG